jgi:hypothetical protein
MFTVSFKKSFVSLVCCAGILTLHGAQLPVAVFQNRPAVGGGGGGEGTLPLDLVTTASAAYSTRLLRTGYGGSLIRVRRSNDNAEQDIGVTGGTNLNTAALLSFVGANSGYVATYYDQSGNGRHLTQGTAGNQPIIVLGGTLVTNAAGLTVPHYTGGPYHSYNGITTVSNLAFVCKLTSQSTSPANHAFFGKQNYGSLSGGYASPNYNINNNAYSSSSAAPWTTTNTVVNVVNLCSNATAFLFTNGVFQTTRSVTLATNNYPVYVGMDFGGVSAWNGKIWDIYLFSTNLSLTEISNLNTF